MSAPSAAPGHRDTAVPPAFRAAYPAASSAHPRLGAMVVTITGELDLDITADLRDLLVEAVDSGNDRIVVDLTGVRFIGSRALGTLAVAAHRAADRGAEMYVAAVHPLVVRAIEVTGLAFLLRLVGSVAEVPVRAAVDDGALRHPPAWHPGS